MIYISGTMYLIGWKANRWLVKETHLIHLKRHTIFLSFRFWTPSSQWWTGGMPGNRVFFVLNSVPLLTLTSGMLWTAWANPTAMKPCRWMHVKNWISASVVPSLGMLQPHSGSLQTPTSVVQKSNKENDTKTPELHPLRFAGVEFLFLFFP